MKKYIIYRSRWLSWKMAATLKFQVAGTIFLSSDSWRLLMPIFMLASPNAWLCDLCAPLIWSLLDSECDFKAVVHSTTAAIHKLRFPLNQMFHRNTNLLFELLASNIHILTPTRPPYMVVVFPAPLCPRKETTWFSWRFRLSLLRASLLPFLYTLVSLSIQTTRGKWLGSSSMPRISSGDLMKKA